MKRYRLDPKKPRQLTPAEARRLDEMPIDYSDIPPLGDDFFTKAKAAWPPAKEQLTIRLDADGPELAEGQRQRLSNAHQPHFACCHGESAVAPVTFHTSTEEEHSLTWHIKASMTFHKR